MLGRHPNSAVGSEKPPPRPAPRRGSRVTDCADEGAVAVMRVPSRSCVTGCADGGAAARGPRARWEGLAIQRSARRGPRRARLPAGVPGAEALAQPRQQALRQDLAEALAPSSRPVDGLLALLHQLRAVPREEVGDDPLEAAGRALRDAEGGPQRQQPRVLVVQGRGLPALLRAGVALVPRLIEVRLLHEHQALQRHQHL
mmetsp:Transcript_45800/g.129550  ORF Transcript_45800/g.129550 Transcript_45800/m.129550 type:complete len:200 (-) Transcript_45800:331-930(-)